MGTFSRGSVVLTNFPHSDYEDSDIRPAFVVLDLPSNDYILCMITKKMRSPELSVEIDNDDLDSGFLRNNASYVRLDRLFTFAETEIIRQIGSVKLGKRGEIKDTFHRMLCEAPLF